MAGYLVLRDGKQEGPFEDNEVLRQVELGYLTAYDLCWREGMSTWQPISTEIPTSAQISALPRVITNAPAMQSGTSSIFLHISIPRLIVMSILSFSLFEVYWSYKNWRFLKERHNLKVSPFWRGVFGIFFIHRLLAYIHDDQNSQSVVAPSFNPKSLATSWVVLILLANVLSRSGSILAVMAAAFVPSYMCLVPVQKYINTATVGISPNKKFDGWSFGQIFCLTIGLLIWLGLIAGLTMGQS